MCKITETVSEVNQIRAEKTRPRSGISPVTMETIMEIDRRRSETSYLTFLSLYLCLFLSLLFSPLLYLALYLPVYLSRSQSTMSAVTDLYRFFFQPRSVSICVVVHLLCGVQ